MVGSIKMTVEEGQFVKKGEEFGYFAFGECCRLYVTSKSPGLSPLSCSRRVDDCDVV